MGDLIGISRQTNFSERQNCARWRLCQEVRLVWGDSCLYSRYPKHKDFWISQCFPGFSCCDNGSIQFFCKIQYGCRDLFTLTSSSITNSFILSYNGTRTRTSLLGHGLFIFFLVEDCLVLRIKTWQFKSQIISHALPLCYEIWDFSSSGFPDWISKAGTYQMYLLKSNIKFGFQFRNFVTS